MHSIKRRDWRRIVVIYLGILALTACAPAELSSSSRSAPTAAAAATATATAEVPSPIPSGTPTPLPTATPTPYPTPDPTRLSETAKRGRARLQTLAGDAELVCFRYEDTDGDGTPEWLALTHQPDAGPRLSAFVLDGETYHALPAAHPKPGEADVGLGQYATCEVEIRDVNADGRPDVAIFGHAEQNETLMHLYTWERDAYRLLGAFRGTAGVHFEDRDGDLFEEIIEGHRDTAAPALAWHIIFTWDGQTYGWTSDRWAWYRLDRPHAYPTHKPLYAVISFYLAVNDRDMPAAYNLLTSTTQAARDYTAWVAGFARTLRVDVGAVHEVPGVGSEDQRRVAAQIVSWDNEDGRVLVRTWEATWETVRTDAGWRLAGSELTLLDEWEAEYWR